jgi:NADPH-dependent ferric siderophore reductase
VTNVHAPGDARGGLFDRMLRHATVVEVEQLRPRIRRIRTYSIVELDRAGQWLDLCVYRHNEGHTPGLDWTRAAVVGDTVAFMGPQGRLVARDDAGSNAST